MVLADVPQLDRPHLELVGDPVVQGKEVCAASYQGRVGCYEAATGRQVWARDVSSLTGVSLDARYAFVADEKGTLQAFEGYHDPPTCLMTSPSRKIDPATTIRGEARQAASCE